MPSCKSFYEDLVTCLLKSDCVRKEGRTVKECLQREHNDSVPEECRHLQKSFVECKRNMVGCSMIFSEFSIENAGNSNIIVYI